MRLYFICILLLFSAVCLGNVLHVPAEYSSIQQAIDAAANGDTIIVSPGRYFENINFLGKAIDVSSTDPNDPNIAAATILDGSCPADANFASAATFKNGETNTSILEGFTITCGSGSWLQIYWEFKGYLWNRCGGGILCANFSSPTIRKNIITNNIAGQGAGIYCYNHSNAAISDNTICDNNSTVNHGYSDPDANDPNIYDHGDGGAIVGFQYCNMTIQNNIIRHNHADLYGGGIHIRQWSNGLIQNNLITQNWSTLGAGIHITYTSAPTIRKNIITENTAGPGGGGGIYIYYNSTPLVEQNLLTQNYCVNGAGIGVYWTSNPIIRNNVIVKNLAGAGIRIVSLTPVITNNTISLNEKGGIQYSIYAAPVINNNIITSNGSGRGIEGVSTAGTITYNDVWGHSAGDYNSIIGNLTGISGNISVDPAFINPDSNDYHLDYFSPCINAGDPNTAPDYNDFDNQNRIMGRFVDLGAFETKPVWNTTKGTQYDNIQAGIDDANNSQTIILIKDVHKGAGNKNVDFKGKAVTVQSMNPADSDTVQSTIIDCENDGRAFQFHSGEDTNSIIAGLTLTNGGGNYDGAIYCCAASPTIKNCFIKNNIMQNGGAIYCTGSNANILNCTVSGNSSLAEELGGGGVCCLDNSNTTIANCIITANSAAANGGGILVNQSNPNIINCTIIGNKANGGGGVYSLNQANSSIANCIVRNNLAQDGNQIAIVNSQTAVSHCDIQNGRSGIFADSNSILNWQSGNIDAEPNFVDAGHWQDVNYITGNYHLLPSSICINSGDNNSVPIQAAVDIDGEQRIFDNDVDIGADEFVTNRADFNSDGIVDFADFYVLYTNWLQDVNNCPADFNGDNFIDSADLAVFAQNWMWKAGWRP